MSLSCTISLILSLVAALLYFSSVQTPSKVVDGIRTPSTAFKRGEWDGIKDW